MADIYDFFRRAKKSSIREHPRDHFGGVSVPRLISSQKFGFNCVLRNLIKCTRISFCRHNRLCCTLLPIRNQTSPWGFRLFAGGRKERAMTWKGGCMSPRECFPAAGHEIVLKSEKAQGSCGNGEPRY